jgi:hypothetical protein
VKDIRACTRTSNDRHDFCCDLLNSPLRTSALATLNNTLSISLYYLTLSLPSLLLQFLSFFLCLQSFLQSAALSCSRGMVSAALRYLDGVGPDERDEEKAIQLLLGAEEQVRQREQKD